MASGLQMELIKSYFLAAFSGAWIWDAATNLSDDYKVFAQSPRKLSNIVFLLSRFTTFTFILLTVITDLFSYSAFGGNSLHSHDLSALYVASEWFFAFAIPLNCALLFFRVRTLFSDQLFVIIMFSTMWILSLTSFASPIACAVFHLCGRSNTLVNCAGIFMITAYNTILYLSLLVRMLGLTSSTADVRGYLRALFYHEEDRAGITKSLFIAGHSFYCVTIFINIFSTITYIVAFAGVASGDVSFVVMVGLGVANIAMQNTLASRIYRDLDLGVEYVKGAITLSDPEDLPISRAEGESQTPQE